MLDLTRAWFFVLMFGAQGGPIGPFTSKATCENIRAEVVEKTSTRYVVVTACYEGYSLVFK